MSTTARRSRKLAIIHHYTNPILRLDLKFEEFTDLVIPLYLESKLLLKLRLVYFHSSYLQHLQH